MKNLSLALMFFSLFILFGCNKIKEKEHILNKKNEKLKINYKIINQDNYIFKVFYSTFDSLYSSIDSVSISFRNKTQTINLSEKKMCYKTKQIDGFPVWTNIDVNFDGNNDIMLYPHVVNYSVYGNDEHSDYFIYNKKNNRFEENVQLDTIYNLNVCTKNKYLFSWYGKDCLRKYLWKGDSLKLTEIIK